MPRGYNTTRILPILRPFRGPKPKPLTGPDLYNAKKRVAVSHGIKHLYHKRIRIQKRIRQLARLQYPSPYDSKFTPSGIFAFREQQIKDLKKELQDLPTPGQIVDELKRDGMSETWRKYVSPDVAEFVDECAIINHDLLPHEKRQIIYNPAHFFSRPYNVPPPLRQQIFFPNFTIALKRCERLGPYYAQFRVPLWFSKLDLKNYLSEVYGVEVVHVRSYVLPAQRERTSVRSPFSKGRLIVQKSKKQMTVQLLEPFEWPVKADEVDLEEFDKPEFERITKQTVRLQEKNEDYFGTYVDKAQRKSIAEQAKELLEGKRKWRPTWQDMPESVRAMTGQQYKAAGIGSPSSSAVTKR